MKDNEHLLRNEFRMTDFRVLVDLKWVLSKYYVADVSIDVDKVVVKFKSGQIFTVTVKEQK